ncbi:DUF4240 domain-containing protein [Pseudonocardia sp. TRM90224]|uniref:DUF4240 domain-containing protein n=1 Tax=Pseudonocardia sp. TRM90224 TaxID=2812678 RepID=UPI001E61C5E2|nr:DUF4240 domain-containing protein [Pseudonocardia sp. TRM90224]
MDLAGFWTLVGDARDRSGGPADADAVASTMSDLLAARPPEEIVAAERIRMELMAGSYRRPLWEAAYLINGGCSDDGFEYFRGWLIMQGRAVFERAVADPDSLAELAIVRSAAADGDELECEEALGVAVDAFEAATGEQLPEGAPTVLYPELEPEWSAEDGDLPEVERRLPRLSRLHLD